jgi:hypothetical protein
MANHTGNQHTGQDNDTDASFDDQMAKLRGHFNTDATEEHSAGHRTPRRRDRQEELRKAKEKRERASRFVVPDGVDVLDAVDALLADLEEERANKPKKPPRQKHTLWRDADAQMSLFLTDAFDIDADTVDMDAHDPAPRVQLATEPDGTTVFRMNLDHIDNVTPVHRKHQGDPDTASEQEIPFGQFTDPRVQVNAPRIFGIIHLALSTHRYSSWQDRIADDADDEVRTDQAAVADYDTARCQCLAATSGTWMQSVVRSGYEYWAGDQAAGLTEDPVTRLQWLITRVILLETGGLLTEDAALAARAEVARHLGEDAVEQILGWAAPLLGDINPSAEDMLYLGHRLRGFWTARAADLDGAGTVVDVEGPLRFAVEAISANLKHRLYKLSFMWRALPWPENDLSITEGGDDEWQGVVGVNHAARKPLPIDDMDAERDPIESALDDRHVQLNSSMHVDWRSTEDSDRTMVRRIRHQLDKARTRTVAVGETPSTTPGGRLNTRQLVQMQAQIASGRKVTATPWTKRRSHHTAAPDVHTALVFDVSPSMGQWNDVAGPLSWALVNAVDQINGTASAWGFATRAVPIVRPHDFTAQQVPVLDDRDMSSEHCADAMREAAQDAELATSTGAKITLVITDGGLPVTEHTQIQQEVHRQNREGITVYWVGAGILAGSAWAPAGVRRLTLTDPENFATDVIATIAAEVREA